MIEEDPGWISSAPLVTEHGHNQDQDQDQDQDQLSSAPLVTELDNSKNANRWKDGRNTIRCRILVTNTIRCRILVTITIASHIIPYRYQTVIVTAIADLA